MATVKKSEDKSTTEKMCLSNGGKTVCFTWDGRCATVGMIIDHYTVTLCPTDQIDLNGTIMGTVKVDTTMPITVCQARDLADWILATMQPPECGEQPKEG